MSTTLSTFRHGRAIAAAVALAAVIGFGSAVAAQNVASAPVPQPPGTDEAWLRYRDALQKKRQDILASPFSTSAQIRAQGLYFVQSLEATAFNMYMAPRTQYPALYTQSIYMPFELSWGYPNPDFFYHTGFIDGAHTYRIYGNRKGMYWATLQVLRGMWGDQAGGDIANVDFDDLPTRQNGDFEIFLGPNPPKKTDGKYWVKLDPDIHNNYVMLRETFYDWAKSTPMSVHIEILDRKPDATLNLDEEEIAARLGKARKFVTAAVDNAMRTVSRFVGTGEDGSTQIQANRFVTAADAGKTGGNPLACYVTMVYDIHPGDALVIDMPASDARYWGFQLGSVWGQTTDYSYHQSSINGAQARLDSDGRFRAVISLTDPGVPNWLDPAGIPTGVAALRYYRGTQCTVPSVQKTSLANLRQVLPRATPIITPLQRRQEIDARRAEALGRYGQ